MMLYRKISPGVGTKLVEASRSGNQINIVYIYQTVFLTSVAINNNPRTHLYTNCEHKHHNAYNYRTIRKVKLTNPDAMLNIDCLYTLARGKKAKVKIDVSSKSKELCIA